MYQNGLQELQIISTKKRGLRFPIMDVLEFEIFDDLKRFYCTF